MRIAVSVTCAAAGLFALASPASTVAEGTGNGVEGMTIPVDAEIRAAFEESATASYFIFFRQRPDLSPAYRLGWRERGRFVVEELRRTADAAQPRVRDHLAGSGARFQSFWIDNVIAVESSDLTTFEGLQGFDEIAALRADPGMRVIEPEAMEAPAPVGLFAVEPNIAHVRAPEVWAMGFRGEGLVVGNIDSGVRYTHQALVDAYRGNQGGTFDHRHNWWDAAAGTTAPTDTNGHGTHTMGTMVGDDGEANQIGMAPSARWIGCRAAAGSSIPGANLLECAQFMLAPWDLGQENADPDLRPHVVNNSWGNCDRFYNDWFQGSVDAWHAAGIVPVFSNGNASNCGYSQPPGCNTVGNPGRYANVLGVGSTGTSDGQYASHSNWGPTDDPWEDNPLGFPTIKPNVAAPGVQIRSSLPNGDDGYGLSTGTSMSGPHVAGLVALLWEAAPCLIGDYATTAEVLMAHATPVPYASQCGGEGAGDVPNHAIGWGEIDALDIVNAGIAHCGPQGVVEGTVVRSEGGAPLADVLVEAVGPLVTRRAVTEASGDYQMTAPAGTYEVTASRDGFMPATASGVVVPEGASVTVDFALDPAPRAQITPPALWFEVLRGDGAGDTLHVDNDGDADLVWSVATDLPPAADAASHDGVLDEPLELPDFEVISPAFGGAPVVFTVPAGVLTRSQVVGLSFRGTATGISDTASRASDTCMVVQAPDGTTFGVGGVSATVPGCGEDEWDFQGPGSHDDGIYESEHEDVYDPAVGDEGVWTFTFVNDWHSASAAATTWSEVTVTLHKTPLVICDDVADVRWLSATPGTGITPPGGETPVSVTVDTAELTIDLFAAGLCVATNDPKAPVVPIPVHLRVTEGDEAELLFDPSDLDFGEVELGVVSPPQTALLRSIGNLGVTGLVFTPPGAGFEVDTGACGETLPAGESCPVSVTFSPTEPGPAAAVLPAAGAEEAAATLSLSGTGLDERAFTPMALAVDLRERVSDGNGVLEPGEVVEVAPAWRNDGTTPQRALGAAAGLTGPSGAIYTLVLDSADYGLVESGATAGCGAMDDCYQVGVHGVTARPAAHWKALFEETLSDGSTKTWTLHIGDSFTDVPRSSPFYVSIETLFHHGVTGGCSDSEYCPGGSNTRGQMAVFLLRAVEGDDYLPPVCVEGDELFGDVPFDSGFCPWIEELADRRITSGCGGGDYCPGHPVSRGQMAVFLLKAVMGNDYAPPECTGTFEDVPCPSTFTAWIEELAERGITGGCATGPSTYCPADPVTRAQMATFVTKTFGLPLYGP